MSLGAYMNFSEFLKYGAIGLSACLSVLVYLLLLEQQKLQTNGNINKSMHKQFVKMLYVFWGTCIFMTVIGYGSEILHDRIVKTDNTKELASLKADHSTLNEKYEKLNKDFVSLQLDNVKYKTMVELISKETSRPIAAVAGAKAFTGLPPIPVTGKMEDYKESPYKEPTCSDKPTSADEIYKANVKRILAGQSPISDDEILKQDAKNLKEWDDYRSNLSKWLGKNPGQIKYYDANLRLKPLDGGDAPPAN
jgi:hypothetical protein